MNFQQIDNDRREAADAEFENFDFAEYELEDKSGWESITGSGPAEWTRPLFFTDPEDPDAPSTPGIFRVVFAQNSSEIVEVGASINGNDIGRRAPSQPAP